MTEKEAQRKFEESEKYKTYVFQNVNLRNKCKVYDVKVEEDSMQNNNWIVQIYFRKENIANGSFNEKMNLDDFLVTYKNSKFIANQSNLNLTQLK